MTCLHSLFIFFFFNDTATTEIYTLSLHDALPICDTWATYFSPSLIVLSQPMREDNEGTQFCKTIIGIDHEYLRSEEHTSELQSRPHLVCRLLLEKKKKVQHYPVLVCTS